LIFGSVPLVRIVTMQLFVSLNVIIWVDLLLGNNWNISALSLRRTTTWHDRWHRQHLTITLCMLYLLGQND